MQDMLLENGRHKSIQHLYMKYHGLERMLAYFQEPEGDLVNL